MPSIVSHCIKLNFDKFLSGEYLVMILPKNVDSIFLSIQASACILYLLQVHLCNLNFQNIVFLKNHIKIIIPCGPAMLSQRKLSGDPQFFLAKSLVIPAIYTKFKLIAHKCKLEFCIYGWNYQWFSQKIWRSPTEGLWGGLWTISAGTTLLVQTQKFITKIGKIRNIKEPQGTQ